MFRKSEMAHPASNDVILEQLPGIGSARVDLFKRLGIRRPIDLLFFFPREYLEPAKLQAYHELQSDTRTAVIGVVDSIDIRGTQDGRSMVGVLLKLEQAGFVRMVWFNQPFRAEAIRRGQRIQASGVIKSTGISYEMRHPEIQILEDAEEAALGLPRPIYRLTEGLKQKNIYDAVKYALDKFASTIQESLPLEILAAHGLYNISTALQNIHQPETLEIAEKARYRFIFQELLVYQLALALRRQKMVAEKSAPRITNTAAIHHRILNRLSLNLTNDQQKAIEEICSDMEQSVPMNRLLQGDVGSGKTAVALYAMLVAVANGFQATFMAPTEILARQHFERLSQVLEGANCQLGLLVGSLSGSEKLELQTQLAIGTVDIVIGTQALLSDRVEFHNLGLAVIDEQHKFGVAQRASLRGTSLQPHYLVLSATPIPRTLAMSAFGDLDVSTIREKPAGRVKVHTYLARHDELQSWWNFVKSKVAEGRQAYVIAPRVEGDESSDVHGAEDVFQRLAKQDLSELRIGLLHGRIDPQKKNETLAKFDRGEIDVLVATTVVEVGIDVPNATVMTILDADRLGLAQLHQLRGRVGRSNHQGYVCVFAKASAEESSIDKLRSFTEIDDGFELAELDLKIRGPGNLLGTQQTGLPPFRIADIVRDEKVLELTRHVAEEIVKHDANLDDPKLSRLKQQVLAKHGGMIDFGDVG